MKVFPEYYSVSLTPSEIYLSPACRVKTASGAESIDPVPGPGVILREDQIVSLEFIDEDISQCNKKFPR